MVCVSEGAEKEGEHMCVCGCDPSRACVWLDGDSPVVVRSSEVGG